MFASSMAEERCIEIHLKCESEIVGFSKVIGEMVISLNLSENHSEDGRTSILCAVASASMMQYLRSFHSNWLSELR